MARNFEAYDLQLAIDARRMLMLEANTLEDCLKKVYEPSMEMIGRLLASKPKEITCLRGKIITSKNQLGSLCDVDIVCLENKICYVGTVRDWSQAVLNWERFLNRFRNYPDRIEHLVKRGAMAIMRHSVRCDIPVQSKQLTPQSLEEGIRKFFKTFFPGVDCDLIRIKWMDRRRQAYIGNKIVREARKQARPQTDGEKMKIFEDWAPIYK